MLKKLLIIFVIFFSLFVQTHFSVDAADKALHTAIASWNNEAEIINATRDYENAQKKAEANAEPLWVIADQARSDYIKAQTAANDVAGDDHIIKGDMQNKADAARANYDTAQEQYNQALFESNDELQDLNEAKAVYWNDAQKMEWSQWMADEAQRKADAASSDDPLIKRDLQKKADAAQALADTAAQTYHTWPESEWDVRSPGFKIKVNSISPGMDVKEKTVEKSVNYVLATIIQRGMIMLWSLALLVMTVWAWYMILHHWQDELLSKWKSIFMSWIYALVVALSSYYIVSMLRYILYQWDK